MLTRKRIIWLGIRIAVVGLLIGAFFLFKFVSTKIATNSVNKTLNAKSTKDELAKGNCSDDTIKKLKEFNKGADDKTVAKGYESLGLCLVYKKDFEGAITAYKQAAENYRKADMKDEAERNDGAVTG